MRKHYGLILIGVSFLIGSYICVLDLHTVPWVGYMLTLLVGAVGVVLTNRGKKNSESGESTVRDVALLEQHLSKVIKNTARLRTLGENSTHDVRHKIDEWLVPDLNSFVNSRKAIAAYYDLQTYADIMSVFSCGERYINRVWCASADGYIDEVASYLFKAEEQFKEAHRKLNLAKRSASLNMRSVATRHQGQESLSPA